MVILKDHPYHEKSNDELKYIISDARDAANNVAGFNYDVESKYLDKINDAVTILRYRKTHGTGFVKTDMVGQG